MTFTTFHSESFDKKYISVIKTTIANIDIEKSMTLSLVSSYILWVLHIWFNAICNFWNFNKPTVTCHRFVLVAWPMLIYLAKFMQNKWLG